MKTLNYTQDKNGQVFGYDSTESDQCLAVKRIAGEGHQEYDFVPEPPTPDQLLAALSASVQQHLDTIAQAYRYDGILSAVSYADDGTAFGKQGAAFKAWRSAVWLAAAEIEAEVKDGKRDIPTEKELIELLPKFEEAK
jgi:hypothetical protein